MATIEKALFKIAVANSLGADLEDMRDGARRVEQQLIGGEQALGIALKNLASFSNHIDKDLEEEKIDEKEAASARLWAGRAVAAVDNLRILTEKERFVSAGKVAGLESAMNVVMKMAKREEQKKALAEMGSPAAPGNHPGPSEASVRKLAESKKKVPKKRVAKKRPVKKNA